MEHEHRQKKAAWLESLSGLLKGSPPTDAAMHRLFTALLEVVDDALMITDRQFIIRYTNHSVHHLFGYRPPELIAQHLSVLFSDRQWVPFEEACLAYATQPDRDSRHFRRAVTMIHKGRLELAAMVRLQYLPVDHESLFVFLFRDLEHRVDAQQMQQHRRPQHLRLQAIGRLTAGLTHEYNNLLTSIVGYSEILKLRLNQDETLSRNIEHISQASNRAADLTRYVMTFSRHRSNHPEMCDLNAIILDMEKMIRGLFHEDIDLVFQFTPNLGMVWIDLGVLLQILIIVILAVREAQTQDCRVIIATHSHWGGSDRTSSPGEDAGGEFVHLAIGCKMETSSVAVDQHDTIPLALEALQEDLEGVFNLVRQVGGEIEVVDDAATEKTYNIYFPVAQHPPLRKAADNVSQASRPRLETILIVDDDDMIRALVSGALQAEGYQVLEASGATEALDISRQHEKTIHLLVSDIVMPGMNGRELADRLVVERPHLKLLFISGHSPQRLTRVGLDRLEGRFLQKPFATSTLVEKVRLALTPPPDNARRQTWS